MAREEFDRDLGQVEAEVVLLGGLVEAAIFSALEALASRDLELSQIIIDADDRIDEKQVEIENACVELIRREAPIAGDLRRLLSSFQISGELERMGDYAEGIAKISLRMGDQPPLKELIDIPRMADLAVTMLKRSLESFLERDPERAEAIGRSLGADDDEVDDLYEQVQQDLIELMKKDPDNVERATYLLWAAHNMERIADRATNIAERSIFQATGKIVNIAEVDAAGVAPA